jgi:serine/threonine-protein kinase
MENSPAVNMLGQYKLIRKLGEGGAGQVYLARHSILEQNYAVKVLRHEFHDNEQFTERFFREARLAARLVHPNIVKVVTADRYEDAYYLVMDFIEGISLEEMVAHGALEAHRAVRYVIHVLDGLDYAHTQGMLHRDIKAENILVDGRDEPKIVDFGLVTDVEQRSRLTAPNAVVGTPYYMAPEQWRGEKLDARADIFSAGVLLYYTLTGRFPYPGNSPVSVLHRLTSGTHEPLNSVSISGATPLTAPTLELELEKIVSKALQRERALRYDSAHQFAHELNEWLDAADLSEPASTLAESTRPAPGTRDNSPLESADQLASAGKLDSANQLSRPATGHYHIAAEDKPMTNESPNLAVSPVEIAPNTYWVGKRPDDEIFYANPYLRHFPGSDGNDDFNLIIDPGSSKDFSVVQAKVSQTIGSIKNVSSIFINHQDPDVGSSVGLLLGRYTPKAYVLCTEDTWRLVHYYNIPRKRFVAMEKYPRGLKVPTGHKLVPVPSPFCHFVGAMMLYDPQNRVLFSGDLFGGLTDRDAKGLYADESDWTGMRAFHQIYMPTNQALRHAIANIRALDPPVEIIAPQHGRVIRGKYVQEFMDRLEQLPVGLDVINDRFASEDELQAWTTVLNRVLEVAKVGLGDQAEVLLADDPNLSGIITFTGQGIEVTSLGKTSVERAVRLLCDHLPHEMANSLKYEAIYASQELDLPTPVIELDEDGPGDKDEEPNQSADATFSIASAE